MFWPAFESEKPPRVIACIPGRGFKQRREDMKKLIVATQGGVFAVQAIPQRIAHTGLAAFQTRQPPTV